jgi:hypothetical protein
VANQTCVISDSTFLLLAAVQNSALAGTEYALAVRAIGSPANVKFIATQVPSVSVLPLTPTKISSASPSANRRLIRLKNGGTTNIFLGPDTLVSVANGYVLLAGESEDFEMGPALNIYGTAATSTNGPIYVMELG